MRTKLLNFLVNPIVVLAAISTSAILSYLTGGLGYIFGIVIALMALWASRFAWLEFGISRPEWLKTILKAILYSLGIYLVMDILIQPFVENAIKHGLMNKETKGKLSIKISKNQGFLICSIKDNGVGRKKAAEIREKGKPEHRSLGIAITDERLRILNAQRKNKIHINIHDLEDKSNRDSGTHVEIRIPLNEDLDST